MSSPELIVLNGVPCSGKSTISRAFVANEIDIKVRHLSMGERLRGITNGQITSNFTSLLAGDITNLKNHTNVANPEAPISVFEEFIEQEPADLVILDGFPRYPNEIEGFKQSINKIGSRLLALCEVSIPIDIVQIRNQEREQRYEDVVEDEAFISKRLAEYQSGPAIVMNTLASEYPYHQIDGTLPIEANIAAIRGIYLEHSGRQ